LNYVSIGKIVAVHGLKGEVVLQHALGKKTSLKGVKAIFTQDKSDSWFPWFIKEAKAKSSKEIYLTIEDITTPEAARKLLQKTVWLDEKDVAQHAAPASALSLVGFTVVNEKTKLGEIVEVIEQPHQLLCTIIINEKEVLIPLHEESLLKVDQVKKLVYVDLPDGLLELYL
jgi:16S rRNA processing protein RimM